MRATDELREMLDECGIEYEQSYIEGIAEYTHVTKWKMQTGNECTFYEIEDGYPPYFTRMFIETPTAAQAIAATVHDEASTHKALIRESDARMALQRDYNNQSERIRNQRMNLKEMQAALERRTCRMTLCAAGNDYARYTCSECERETMVPRVVEGVSRDYEPPRYCVNCGREAVE